MAVLPAWRRTGRKAKPEHFEGLVTGAFIEFVGYTDRRAQQGRLLGCLAETSPLNEREKGKAGVMHVLAIEDGYYEYWHETTFGAYAPTVMTPVHFCDTPTGGCKSKTRFRDPVHIDVFRVLSHDEALGLGWLTDVHKSRIEGPAPPGTGAGAGVPGGDTGDADVGPGAGGSAGLPGASGVRPGADGIRGLAGALGAGPRGDVERQAELDALRARKAERLETPNVGADEDRRDDVDKGKDKKRPSEDLLQELQARVPKGPRMSALDYGSSEKKDKKRSKKKKKKKKEKKDDLSGSEEDGTTTSSSEELFRMAALPRGMEKLRSIHQRYPGRIASRSLQRLQELLLNAQGRGTAHLEEEAQQLPAVAVGYLTQVFFNQYPTHVVGLRTTREMRTIAHCIDAVARNDPLRALDIMVQRLKALELSHVQGGWSQANQLELIMGDEEMATFRQEIKAAQLEVKADLSLSQGGARRWKPWKSEATHPGDAPAAAEAKDGDKPPENPMRPPRKGKGKGKRGLKGKRW
eukprot:Skav201089  [mRNA]  locus=scaffold2562:74784:76346:+ [translate_table: standard]